MDLGRRARQAQRLGGRRRVEEEPLGEEALADQRRRVGDRELRDEMLAELATATQSEVVQRIGHVALYYRRHPTKPGIMLPD